MAYSLTYSYNSDSQSYSVIGYSNITTSDKVVIPDKYDDGTHGEHPVKSIGSSAFSGCSSLTSITIGNSVTSISEHAFSSCGNLTSVTIGNSVTVIGWNAFRGCSSLKQLILFPSTPPTLGSSAVPNNVQTIYVQQSSKAAYQAASNWTTFASKIVSDNIYLSFVRFNQKNKEYIDNGLSKKLDKPTTLTSLGFVTIDENGIVETMSTSKKLDFPEFFDYNEESVVTINDVGFVDTKKVSDFLQKTGGNVTGDIHSTGEFTARRFTADEWLAAEGSYADKSALIATALVSSVQGSPDYSYFTIVVDDTSKLFVNKVVALCNDKGLIYGGLSAIRIASIDTNTKTVRFNVPEIDGDTFWGTKIGLYSSTIDETLYRYDRISNDNNYLEFPNSRGTIALTPNAAPSEPSFIITAADRTPTWKPLSEFSSATNLENGTGDVLIQTTDTNHSFKVMTDGRVKVKSAPTESDDVVRKLELDNRIVMSVTVW